MSEKDFWRGYTMGNSDGESGGSPGNGSGFLVFLGCIGGFVLEGWLLTSLHVEVSDVSSFLLFVGWIIGTIVTTFFLLLIFDR